MLEPLGEKVQNKSDNNMLDIYTLSGKFKRNKKLCFISRISWLTATANLSQPTNTAFLLSGI